MWNVLCDPVEDLRETTAQALHACLQMVAERKAAAPDFCRHWYTNIYAKARTYLKENREGVQDNAAVSQY